MKRASAQPSSLAVLSGKGGTGKTTVVAALAALAEEVVLADCDVDAADLVLLFEAVETARDTFVSGSTAHILPERCSGCGECAALCRFAAIHPQDYDGNAVYAVDPLACEGCGLCSHVCTCHAVDMRDAVRGEWFVAETSRGPLVHARLNVGGENSGRLVTLVREQAAALARERGASLLLIDGPPGIGCPAIASVTGADLALLVTEPSVSGAHDLLRVIQLVESLRVPCAVCINKQDVNPGLARDMEALCAERGVPVAGRLDYDPLAVAAQCAGRSVIEHGGHLAGQIEAMWNVINGMLRNEE
jgi:MinD superfamily P-loop ATPase